MTVLTVTLTVSRHANSEAFLEATVLTAIAIQPNNETLAVPQTPVFNLLLNGSSEEALWKKVEKWCWSVNK